MKSYDLSILNINNNYVINGWHGTIFTPNQFQICCIINRNKLKNVICTPQPSIFLTCDKIIPKNSIRYFLWFYGIIGFIGNTFAVYLVLKRERQSSRILRLCLSLSDLSSIFYILFVCIADEILKGDRYLLNERVWRYGIYCRFLGVFVSTSLIFSMFVVMGLTIERYQAIVNPFKRNFIKSNIHIYTGFGLILSILIGVLPIILYKVNRDFNAYYFFSFFY